MAVHAVKVYKVVLLLVLLLQPVRWLSETADTAIRGALLLDVHCVVYLLLLGLLVVARMMYTASICHDLIYVWRAVFVASISPQLMLVAAAVPIPLLWTGIHCWVNLLNLLITVALSCVVGSSKFSTERKATADQGAPFKVGLSRPVSSTALWVAACRALESSRPDALFVDKLAAFFSEEDGFQYAKYVGDVLTENLPKFMVSEKRMNYRNAVQDAVSMHHRRIDDFVVQWLSEQPTGSRRQIVCMGAGLDARPYRMKQLAEEQVDWYELDVPEMIQYKEQKLAQLSRLVQHSKGKHIQNTHQGIQFTLEEEDLVASCNVVRVSCNFEEQDFGDVLKDVGCDFSRPVLWIMEGLLLYLHPNEAHMTLERISELSCPGSALTGDLVDEYFLIWRSGKRDMVGLMQEMGHPFRFGLFRPAAFFHSLGWTKKQEMLLWSQDFDYGRKMQKQPPHWLWFLPHSYVMFCCK